MRLYRYSPITSEDELVAAIQYLHTATHELCLKAIGERLEVAENVGVFTHYQDEYERLVKIREELTDSSVHFNNKYYLLKKPLVMSDGTEYKYLYIRQPDPYRAQVGDIDFAVDPEKFTALKYKIQKDPSKYPYARIFPRSDLDMIELHHPDFDVLPYLIVGTMTEKVRAKIK